jgi:hypothetical protein
MKEEELREKNLDTLYKHREFLDKTRITISNSFDKYMLTFSSGSLYLSILFTNSLITNSLEKELSHKGWLLWGWIFLVVSMVSMLFSIYFSVRAYEEEMNNDDELIDDICEGRSPRKTKNCVSKFVGHLEILGSISFVFGIVALVNFYFSNL